MVCTGPVVIHHHAVPAGDLHDFLTEKCVAALLAHKSEDTSA